MSGFSYVVVGDHPTDVVVITTGRYTEIFSFLHYEKVILTEKQSSSCTGTHEDETTQPMEQKPKRRRSKEAIKQRHRLYRLHKRTKSQ